MAQRCVTPDLPVDRAEHVSSLRLEVKELMAEAMKRVSVTRAMELAMSLSGDQLRIGKVTYAMADCRKMVIVAVGKAAIPMCDAAIRILRPVRMAGENLCGIVVGPKEVSSAPEGFTYFAGGHPLPNSASLRSAHAAMEMLAALASNDLVLFLISGGASAMMEAPLNPATSEKQLRRFYKDLVHSGLPITEVNTLRKHFSAVKGGKLALLAGPAMQSTLIVSDVPEEAADMVGSGPSLPDSSTVEDCRMLLSDPGKRSAFDEDVLRYFDGPALAETPSASDLPFGRSEFTCLLSNQSLLEQVELLAREAGFYTEVDTTCDDWDYRDASAYLMDRLRALRKQHDRVCLVTGGEITVKVTEPSGTGGRNQHFALYTATQLRQDDPALAMISVGSDGVDGNSKAAGALIDSYTMKRIAGLNLDAHEALAHFDSHTLFEALGDTITTGPTGNNLRDVRIFVSA